MATEEDERRLLRALSRLDFLELRAIRKKVLDATERGSEATEMPTFEDAMRNSLASSYLPWVGIGSTALKQLYSDILSCEDEVAKEVMGRVDDGVLGMLGSWDQSDSKRASDALGKFWETFQLDEDVAKLLGVFGNYTRIARRLVAISGVFRQLLQRLVFVGCPRSCVDNDLTQRILNATDDQMKKLAGRLLDGLTGDRKIDEARRCCGELYVPQCPPTTQQLVNVLCKLVALYPQKQGDELSELTGQLRAAQEELLAERQRNKEKRALFAGWNKVKLEEKETELQGVRADLTRARNLYDMKASEVNERLRWLAQALWNWQVKVKRDELLEVQPHDSIDEWYNPHDLFAGGFLALPFFL